MSLVSLSRVAAARRDDFEPRGSTPDSFATISRAADGALPLGAKAIPVATRDPAAPAKPASGGPGERGTSFGDAVKTILSYVPTEIVLVYLAFLNAMSGLGLTAVPVVPAAPPAAAPAGFVPPAIVVPTQAGFVVLFFAALVATPVLVWLTFAGTLRGADKPLPWRPKLWPVWEMVAATIGFAAWAIAINASVPGGNLWVPPSLASPLVLVATVAIGVTAPVFARRLPD